MQRSFYVLLIILSAKIFIVCSNILAACDIELIVLCSAQSFVFFTLGSYIKTDLRKFYGWKPVL